MSGWWWRTAREQEQERTEAHDHDAAWLLALWWLLHGTPSGEQPSVVTGEVAETVAAEVIAALAGTFDAATRQQVVRALPARAAARSGAFATEVSLAQLRDTLHGLQVEMSASPDPHGAPVPPQVATALAAPRDYCFRFREQTVYITLRPPTVPAVG